MTIFDQKFVNNLLRRLFFLCFKLNYAISELVDHDHREQIDGDHGAFRDDRKGQRDLLFYADDCRDQDITRNVYDCRGNKILLELHGLGELIGEDRYHEYRQRYDQERNRNDLSCSYHILIPLS